MEAEKILEEIAKTLAHRTDHVQGAGGNISVKQGDRMWIKASGKRFSGVNAQEGWVVLEHQKVAEYFRSCAEDRESGEKNSLKLIADSVLGGSGKPSMETGFHALLGRVVIHTHSVYANVLNCRKDAAEQYENLKKRLPFESEYIEYYSPGFGLSKALSGDVYKNIPVVFLKNHGIVVHAETMEEALEKLSETDRVLKEFFQLPDWPGYELEQPSSEILNRDFIFPDQVVFFGMGGADEEARRELADAFSYVRSGIKNSGGALQHLDSSEVQYIGGMDMEKYRLSLKQTQDQVQTRSPVIVIPMSGLGSRFKDAGYTDIKPLIEVMGKPIIEWVCDLFPGASDFVFICRDSHLKETPLRSVLERIRPGAAIVAIEGHKKGPVYAVQKAADFIPDDAPVIVNYCDFFMDWDYGDFLSEVTRTDCKGAIPCYTGFHPHLLNPDNVYAVCRTDEEMHLQEIREKHRFHPDPQQNLHSAGTYYFQSGGLMKSVFREMLMRPDLELNGEYYVSLAYVLMLEKHMSVKVYDKVRQFCQWGTPQDLVEFQKWEDIFKKVYSGSVFKENVQA